MGNNLGAFVGDLGGVFSQRFLDFFSPPDCWGKMHPSLTNALIFFRWVGEKTPSRRLL